jgi:hypothetical protein
LTTLGPARSGCLYLAKDPERVDQWSIRISDNMQLKQISRYRTLSCKELVRATAVGRAITPSGIFLQFCNHLERINKCIQCVTVYCAHVRAQGAAVYYGVKTPPSSSSWACCLGTFKMGGSTLLQYTLVRPPLHGALAFIHSYIVNTVPYGKFPAQLSRSKSCINRG